MLTVITADVCPHATMREADDRGFGCPLPSDRRSATDAGNHRAVPAMVPMQGGVSGAVTDAATFLAAPP